MKTKHSILFVALITAGCWGYTVTSSSAIPPTISKKEATILQRASIAAQTNRIAAIRMLQQSNAADASAAIDFAIGNYFLEDGQLEPAASAYQAALKKNSTFYEAAKNLAITYLHQNRPAAIIELYQHRAGIDPPKAETLLMLGQALMMQNDFVAAETALRQAIMLENANRDARKGLAKCLLAQERYKEARQMLRTILDDAPQSAEFWLLLANINIALGNPKRALTALETARRTGANTPQISLLLGDLYLNRGEIDYAAQSYQAAIQTGSPALEHILHAVAEIVRFGDVNNAHKLLTAINTGQLSPQQLRQHLQIKADLARIEGRPNEAIKLYRQLLEKAPTDGRILLSLGNAQESAGDNIAAEITYERASRVPAVKREAIIARVRLAVGNNHYPQAIKLLQQAQAIKDTSGVKRYLQELQNLQKIIDNH